MRLPTPLRRLTTTTTAAVAATATLAALLAGAPASAGPADASDRAGDATAFPLLPEQAQGDEQAAQQAAEQALDAVQDVLDGPEVPAAAGSAEPTRELTLLLRDLFALKDELAPADERVAARILARPVSQQNDCGAGEPGQNSPFCIHWVTSGSDAPPTADTYPANGIPDQVDRTRETFADVWQEIVTEGGYKRPLPDGGTGRGPDSRFDIYLEDVGAANLYGSCTGTTPATGTSTSPYVVAAYCTLDDDYSSAQFPTNTSLENLQVTAAHEFFHAVQFAYDAYEDGWFMEGTAAWVEDEVYDDVDDNRQYLRLSPLTQPTRPLDRAANLDIYGSWIWWRFLSETYPDEGTSGLPLVLRSVWERASNEDVGSFSRVGPYSILAVDRELAARGTSLPVVLGRFHAQNRDPRGFYAEGASYRRAPSGAGYTLSGSRRSSGARAVTLDHLSSSTVRFTRGSRLPGAWRLKVDVNMPNLARQPRAVLTSIPTDGGPRVRRHIRLNSAGVGKRLVSFSPSTAAVELTLVNAGHRYVCQRGTQYSCQGGAPRDDDLRSTFKATARR